MPFRIVILFSATHPDSPSPSGISRDENRRKSSPGNSNGIRRANRTAGTTLGFIENDRTGYRVVVPMSAGTGERGDYVVVDDPLSVDQAASDAERTSAVEWWNGSMSTRLNNLRTGHMVVIQQRVREADLTGDLLMRGGY